MEDEAYSVPGQYMFGDSLLVSPVSSAPHNNITGIATKHVWLPTSSPWLQFVNGVQVTNATVKSEWAPTEIPAFVRAGPAGANLMPLRTMNSTYTAFADPLVWVVWMAPNGDGSNVSYEMFEDAGDGLDYQQVGNTAHAMTTAHVAHGGGSIGKAGGTTATVVVGPSVGSFKGQGNSRRQLVQFRLGDAADPQTVTVNGKAIPRLHTAPAFGSAVLGELEVGWFRAAQSENGQDNYTQPVDALVVAAGKRSIHQHLSVVVKWA